MADIAADQNFLFGLIALQNGLIDQSALVAAFHAWTREGEPDGQPSGGRGRIWAENNVDCWKVSLPSTSGSTEATQGRASPPSMPVARLARTWRRLAIAISTPR